MPWKSRKNDTAFEDNIITAFLQHYRLVQIQKQGYRKTTSVWGRIASELYSNTLQFRKWLYNFWHEDRRGLRTKTLLMVQSEKKASDYKLPDDSCSSVMYHNCKDWSLPISAEATQLNVNVSGVVDPQSVVVSHNNNNAEHDCASKFWPLFSEKEDVHISNEIRLQTIVDNDDHLCVSGGIDMSLSDRELVVRNSTLQQMLSTEIPVATTGEFRASCLPSFTITLCISEWRQIYLGSSQPGLQAGWATLLAEKIKEYNRFCVFTFIYNRIKIKNSRKRSAPFWYGKAKCKFNGCVMLYLSIKDKPKKEASCVRINISVRGQVRHAVGHDYKRHTRQPERIKLRKELKGDTPSQLRVKLISHCDPEALIAGNHNDIKSSSVLQKNSSEANLDGRTDRDIVQDCINIQGRQDAEEHFVYKTGHSYLQVISASPFELHMYMEVQLHLLLDLQRAGLSELYLDATGSVVRKPPSVKHQILYYALCTKVPSDSSCIIPIAEMLTSDQSTPTISHWLALLSRDMFRVTGHHLKPQKVECDHSWALIHAVIEVFNHVTPLHYLRMCYDACVNDRKVNFTVLHICAAHMIKLMVGHVSKLKLSRDLKSFFLYSFALLQNGKTIQDCSELIKRLTIIFGSKYLTDDCRKAVSTIQQDLKNQKISASDQYFELEDDIMETPSEYVYQGSPFVKLIPQDNLEDESLSSALQPNIYYNLELKKLLSRYIRTLPLWSGIMLQSKSCPQTRDSNSNAENWFRIVKNQVLHSKLHRRAAEFVEIMKETIQGRLRVAAIGIFQENNPKEDLPKRRCSKKTKKIEDIPHPLTLVETWSKRPQSASHKIPKYYRAPPVSLHKGKHGEYDCAPWNGTAHLNRRKVVLRNTCTIDNLLYIIHMSIEQYPDLKKEIKALQNSVEAVNILLRVNAAFSEKKWSTGKMEWLLQFERFKGKSLWDCYGTEEEMVTSPLSYFWHTTQTSTCSNQDCSEKECNIKSSEIVLCLSDAQEIQEALNVFHEPSSLPCTMYFIERELPINDQKDCLTSDHGTRITLKKCRGTRQLGSRLFANGLPCMLIITIAVKGPHRNTNQFDPRNFPADISVHTIKYKIVGITYNTGQHFVCFHKFGKNGNWHLYDGLREQQSSGHGNIEATEAVFSNFLKKHPLPNHIVALCQS